MREKIKPGVYAILSAIALCISGRISVTVSGWAKLAAELSGEKEQAFVIVFLLMILNTTSWSIYISGRQWITHIIAACISCCMLIGKSFSQTGDIKFIFGDIKLFCIAAIVLWEFYK